MSEKKNWNDIKKKMGFDLEDIRISTSEKIISRIRRDKTFCKMLMWIYANFEMVGNFNRNDLANYLGQTRQEVGRKIEVLKRLNLIKEDKASLKAILYFPVIEKEVKTIDEYVLMAKEYYK